MTEISQIRASRLLFQLPARSRFMRLLNPANEWGWQEVLLSNIDHGLKVLAWQNTEDGQKGRKSTAPKPFIPTFMKKASDNQQAMDIDDLKSFLNRKREA